MDTATDAGPSTVVSAKPLASSKLGRTSGKSWKPMKETAVRRSYLSPAIKTPFEKRKERERAKEAVKAVEREMKDDKAAEDERCAPHQVEC